MLVNGVLGYSTSRKGSHDHNSNADPNPDLTQGDGAGRKENSPAAGSPEAGDATASVKASEAKGKYHGISGFVDELEYVECNTGNIDPEQALQEQREIEKFLAEKDAVKTKTGSTFDRICRDQLKVPFELQYHYRKWLLQLKDDEGKPRLIEEWIPTSRGSKLKPGIKLPPPYGPEWEEMVKTRGEKWESKYMDYAAIRSCEAAVHFTVETIRAATALFYEDKPTNKTELRAMRAKRRVKTQAGVPADLPQAPKSISKALWQFNRAEAQKWLESILKEWNGLDDLGVFEHGFTYADLRARGIHTTPIPLSQALDYKFDKNGDISRYKTRLPLAGHAGNMQKGVHFKETYAPTPSQNSSRLLQALMVLYRLKRLTFDVAQAYCQSDLPADERIAVRYPDGFKRKHPETGEELFMILKKSLYGHPAAGRYWDKHRNETVLRLFNEDGYKAKRSVREPSLVVITRGEEYAFALTHTDDVDLVGTSDEFLKGIHAKLNNEWECKITDPSFMLGVERNIVKDDDEGMTVELKMTAFVEAMAEHFKEWISPKQIHTPVKEHMFLHKPLKSDAESEAKAEEIIARGGQRLLGMLLWAARGVYPECQMGASMLGRVMAKPTEEFWNNAVHMMNYMYQNRHRGIMFSSVGNNTPVAYVDASNKPDPTDSKCQYGYAIMLAGGPIVTHSKKLSHVGLSAAHNEYMALQWCNRHVVWLRHLLVEMGYSDMVSDPTVVRGDNTAANQLCYEDIVTSGNQFIITPYHYNKEVVTLRLVEVKYVKSEDNLADLTTKAVDRTTSGRLTDRLAGYEPLTQEEAQG